MFFPFAETPAAPGAEQQPTPGRLPLPSQRGVSVLGQDAARREPRYTWRACDRKWSDRLRASVGTRRTCCGSVGPSWPWGFWVEERWWCRQRRKKVTEPYISRDEIFMFCREDHQVGAQQADKGGEKCIAACLFCPHVRFFCDSSPACHLDSFEHRTAKKFCRTPNPIFKCVILYSPDVGISPILCCAFSVRKGSTWSRSSSPSSTPANLPSPNRAARSSPSWAPRRKTIKRLVCFPFLPVLLMSVDRKKHHIVVCCAKSAVSVSKVCGEIRIDPKSIETKKTLTTNVTLFVFIYYLVIMAQ